MKTLVIGASENPDRYSNRAVRLLRQKGHDVVAFGNRTGKVGDVSILTEFPAGESIDTVTMYVGPANQPALYDKILGLKPRRIIFNPGTENPELEKMASEKGIEIQEACTLVMLNIGNY